MKNKSWPEDAPAGQTWKCSKCNSMATLGCNAGYHRDSENHGDPVLTQMPKEKKATKNLNSSMVIAMEWGFKAHENGMSFELALEKFSKLISK